jgi:hypothetical protein
MKYKINELEDCIGEYTVYRYELECGWTEEMCRDIRIFGELKIFKHFPRPYFHIKTSSLLIKGIIGDYSIEVTYFDYADNNTKEHFESVLKDIKTGGSNHVFTN